MTEMFVGLYLFSIQVIKDTPSGELPLQPGLGCFDIRDDADTTTPGVAGVKEQGHIRRPLFARIFPAESNEDVHDLREKRDDGLGRRFTFRLDIFPIQYPSTANASTKRQPQLDPLRALIS